MEVLGEVIHGYRIDRALSGDKGGFGDVFFATHVESGAEAVVKVLKPEMSARRDIVTRFFNEARAAASVHHPGIVQIHNVGYHGDRAYLLMERLRGDDLETRLKQGPVPLDRAIVFMRQASGAIGAAHARGIVHRDLKPANLFVVSDPDVVGGERVRVLDFGIAKLGIDAGGGKTQGVFGTPSYMSPEQCASAGAVDARADLYSLGCIFYELVCGSPPFGHGGLELIAAHLRDAPRPPRVLAPWLPAPIEQLILQLLEKQPDHRPPSCAALIAALDHAAAASGISGISSPHLSQASAAASFSSAPSTTLGASAGAAPTAAPRARSRSGWLAAGVLVAGAAVAVVVLSSRGDPPERAPSAAPDAGVAFVASPDAPQLAVAPPDAALADAVQPAEAASAPAADPAVTVVATADPPRPVAKPPVVKPARKPAAKPRTPSVPATNEAATPRDPAPEPAVAKPTSPSQAELAVRLNEEGKQLMYADKEAAAVQKFREAVARDPSPVYLVNLCAAQLQVGRLDHALATCRTVESNHPTADQLRKARALTAKIRAEAARLNVTLP